MLVKKAGTILVNLDTKNWDKNGIKLKLELSRC